MKNTQIQIFKKNVDKGIREFLLMFLLSITCIVGMTAQITPPNANSDVECGADCFDLFTWSQSEDGAGDPIPNVGEGQAEDNGCNTIIMSEVEYSGPDASPDLSGQFLAANTQGNDPWTDSWTVTFSAELTNPVIDFNALLGDTQVSITDCDGLPISLTDISTGTTYPAGTFDGNDEVQLGGSYACVIIELSNDRSDNYNFSVGTCLGADPLPPCIACNADESLKYLTLRNATGTGTGATADVELDGILYGSAEVLFSDLDVTEDLSGSTFGAFDNDGGVFVLRIDLCEAISVQQVNILGLETESQAWVGNTLAGMGASGIPGGINLSQCGGRPTMAPVGNMVTNIATSCANQGNGNYTVDGGLMTNTLYFRYENPTGGCTYDKATFQIGACVSDGGDAVPTCPLTVLTVTEDANAYAADLLAGGDGSSESFEIIRDVNGNYFDRTCNNIETSVTNMNTIATLALSPCTEVIDEADCNFCEPVPPCVDCPADTEYGYINLTNYDDATQTGDVELDGILIGTSSLIFSDLDISTDFSGSRFGAFDNDGGVFVMQIDFCDPVAINQLDILGLETESQTWVGTSLSGTSSAGIPVGLNLTKCGGDADMIVSNGNMVVNEASSCTNQGDANFTIDQSVSTLYFRYENPDGGCTFDKATFRLGVCIPELVDAVPVCPLNIVTLTEERDAYLADVQGGGDGSAFTFELLQDANGNFFDRTCANIEGDVNNMNAIPTVKVSPCAEITNETVCNFCEVVPPCVLCPDDTDYGYVTLTGYNAGIQMGDVRLDGVVIGTSTLVFSDLDVNTDFSGSRFGAFDNDGGVMVMRLDFCEPMSIQQLDILGLETESQTWVGTSLNGVGMAGIPAGLNLTKCGGDVDMTVSNGNMVVNEAPNCSNQGDANFSLNQTVSTLYFRYENPDGGCRFDKATFRLGVCIPDLETVVPECDLTLVDEVVTLADGTVETNRLLLDVTGKYFDINSCPNMIPEDAVLEYRISPCAVIEQVEICPVCLRPGLAKQIENVASPAASDVPGNIDVTFKFTLGNYIGEMENLIINDNLAAIPGFVQAFPAQTTVMISSNTSGNAVAPGANASYAGTGNILDGMSGFLMEGDAIMVTITAEFDASMVPTDLVNIAQGGGSRGGNPPVLDDSVAGTNPDPDGDGEPDNNGTNNPNDLGDGATIYFPSINMTKKLVEVFPVSQCGTETHVNARFELNIENTGNVDLTDIQVTDDLIGQLGSAFIDISFIQYAEITTSTATTNPDLNNGFNDYMFETNIFDGTSGLLEPGQIITVQFITELNPDAAGAPAILENQASVRATALNPITNAVLNIPNTTTPFIVNDLSDDGMNPHTTNDDFAGTGQNDPTPLAGRLPVIALAKSVTDVVSAPTVGNQYITYTLRAENLGNATLTNIQVTDAAAAQLGDAFVGFVSGPAVSNVSASLPAINNEFNAGFESNIFNGTGGSMEPGEGFTVSFTLEVNPSAVDDPTELTNQAEIRANSGSTLLVDLSDSGTNPDSNNLGEAGDTGCSNDPTPLFGSFPIIVSVPTDFDFESYGVGLTPLNDFIENDGGLVIITPEECQPAVITNDYSPNNFVEGCSAYSGSNSFTISYADACGNTFDFPVTVSIEDTTPPSCVKPTDLTLDCNAPNYDATLSAYTAYWGPVTDLSHPITIESSYNPEAFDENGQQTIVWTFTDACGNSRQWDAVLTLTGDCSPEEDCLANAGTLTAAISTVELSNGTANISATANGNAVIPADYSVVYVLTTGTDLVIQQVNATAPSFTVSEAGDYTLHTLVYDENTLDLGIVTPGVTTGFDVLALTIAGGGDICASLDATGATVTVEAEEIDETGELTVTSPINYTLGCSETVPASEVNAATTCADGLINVQESEEVTPMGCPGSFTLVRTYIVSDNCGNSETVTQTIVVEDNDGPVFSIVPANADVTCETYPGGFGTPSVGDACSAVTLTFEDSLEEYICDADFNITRTWTATDECGNATTAAQTLTVWPDTEAPVFTFAPGDQTITCSETVAFGTPIVEDQCTAFTMTESVTATGACPDSYTTTKTWIATDACGNSSSISQTITVLAPPILRFVAIPEDAYTGCGTATNFGSPICESNCADGFTVTHEDTTEAGECGSTEIITRTWTAVDACGNTATCSQTNYVVDTTAPVFTAVPDDKTIACNQTIIFNEPEVADLCGGVSLTFADVVNWEDCNGGAYSETRTWYAEDGCGNVSTFQNTMTVAEDTEAPTFNIENQVLTMTPWEYFLWNAPEVIADDNCAVMVLSDMATYTHSDGSISHTWIAIDGCGNKKAVTITVEITGAINSEGITLNPQGLNVYPNPTEGKLNVSFISKYEGNTMFVITDITGYTVMREEIGVNMGENVLRLDTQELPTGTYLLKAVVGESELTQRFVKF